MRSLLAREARRWIVGELKCLTAGQAQIRSLAQKAQNQWEDLGVATAQAKLKEEREEAQHGNVVSQEERVERQKEKQQLENAVRRVEEARRAQRVPVHERVQRGLQQSWRLILAATKKTKTLMVNALKMDRKDWAHAIRRGWWGFIKEMKHYWAGMKLLSTEIRIAGRHTRKLLIQGDLTRRERKQLTRTVADVFRLVPVMAFLLIPFMEVLLPFALKLFPNMLPSTFQDNKLKQDEDMKRRVQAKLELARFLQDTYAVMARESKRDADHHGQTERGKRLSEFIAALRRGDSVTNQDIERFAKLFRDDLTLDNCDRVQLTTMCKFIGVKPYGTDAFLRYQVRRRLRQIKQDDRMILEEGVESLSGPELQSACRARGLRWEGESEEGMRAQLRDWLDLSLNKALPSSLLILSRAFLLTHPRHEDQHQATMEDLQSTLASLPDELVTDIENESGQLGLDSESRQSRLEYLRHQEQLINEEREETHAHEERVAPETQKQEESPESEQGGQPVQEVLPVDQMREESEAERLEKAASSRRKLIRQLSGALSTLSSAHAVSAEREELADLLRTELDRYEGILDESSKADEKEAVRSSSQSPIADAVSSRVDDMLASLQKEIDRVDETSSRPDKPLDRDCDGRISAEELDNATQFLREKLESQDIRQLLREAGILNSDGSIRVRDLHRAARGSDDDGKDPS